ncbi:carboxylate-amine ligase [Magnetospira sp. QH-2]|uniref:carboxylate-amine ligase n=1 Tax=Magnetospira sp. (strain QH-2) TaxID=1288970 RepID=UPI0003E81B87|nr:carboxylate-amine ligase [Magnetospira sp. QH-2]CCQ72785.1 Carboxylate-amine ligase [Magnetospira sp. QH-2]
MPYAEPSFTIGIEEEYLLIDHETRDLVVDPPDALFEDCEQAVGNLVRPEFMRSQIEVGTSVCGDIHAARADLQRLRSRVANVANKHGYAIIAASTHPFAQWMDQKHTDKARYHILAEDMQAVAQRLLICGMHVHVGIEDDELRIDLMNQVSYFLPHLLALSTSSPFWRGHRTGLKSYRLAVFDELPRTGLPERFDSWAEYERHWKVLAKAGLFEDPSMIWWDVRPAHKFPTLEMRITDICTRLDDALSVAALYTCILRMLYRLAHDNQRWRIYADMLIQENRWRAQRYGFDKGLVDFGRGRLVPSGQLMDELLELTAEDAEALDCQRELAHARSLVDNGTCADRQMRVFEQAVENGADKQEALKQVVDFLIEETLRGID